MYVCVVFTLTWPRSRLYRFIFHTRSEHKVPVHQSEAGCGSAWRSQRMYSAEGYSKRWKWHTWASAVFHVWDFPTWSMQRHSCTGAQVLSDHPV